MKNSINNYCVAILIVKVLPIIFFILIVVMSSNAQGLKFSTYVEQTIATPKLGYSLGVVMPGYAGDFEVGGFFQKSALNERTERTKKTIEQQFYGMYMSVSFIQSDKINVNFSFRTGLVNSHILVITPSLFTDIMLTDLIGVGAGIRLRNFIPTGQVRAIVKLQR